MKPVRLAIVGTGGIGRIHAELAAAIPEVELMALCGLDGDAPVLADRLGVPLRRDYRSLTDVELDAVVVATPNQLHLEVGDFFARHGVHLLVEKPITDTVAGGRELCRVARANGVHLLVGQHRRHNPIVRAARRVVDEELGRLVATNAMITMRKPDSYYAPEWRRAAGAGPLLVNLIHEVDVQRAVCGEIVAVQSAATRIGRDFAFDDTAVVLLHFANGALGTMVITESTPSPWSWEASVSEGMGFHNAGRDNARFLGTNGSLSFPSMTLWSYDPADGEPGWRSPLHARRVGVTGDLTADNPYISQLRNLARVVRGLEAPVVTGEDGLRSLAVVEAVVSAARTGGLVDVDTIMAGA